VARRFGGRLTLESVVGQGTTAALVLPAWIAEDDEAPEPSLRILCLDRDAAFRAWVAQVLSFQGHRVTTAAGVRQGVAAFVEALKEEEPFHVVVLGAESEGDPGPGLLDAFRGTDPDVRLVLAGPWKLDHSEREGVVAALDRPLSTGVLESVVRRIALGQRAGR
jgi:DNA-binding NtrC family response regulator